MSPAFNETSGSPSARAVAHPSRKVKERQVHSRITQRRGKRVHGRGRETPGRTKLRAEERRSREMDRAQHLRIGRPDTRHSHS